MSDQDLRRLQRAWREDPGPEAEAALVRARLRAGTLEREQAELLAFVGAEGARAALGLAPDDERLPARLFAPGVVLPLASAAALAGGRIRAAALTRDADLAVLLRIEGAAMTREATGLLDVVAEVAALGPRRCVLDAAGLIAVGSGALGALVRAMCWGAPLALAAVPDRLRIVIDMLGINALLALSPTVEAAFAAGPGPAAEAFAGPPRPPALVRLLALSRWGPEPCRRAVAALAAGPAAPSAGPPPRRLGGSSRRAPAPTAAARGWAEVADHLARTARWSPCHVEGRADADRPLPEVDLERVRAALVGWVLGETP